MTFNVTHLRRHQTIKYVYCRVFIPVSNGVKSVKSTTKCRSYNQKRVGVFFCTQCMYVCIVLYDLCCKVSSPDGAHQVGKISKQWTGFVKEYFTDADNFGVSCTLHHLLVALIVPVLYVALIVPVLYVAVLVLVL